MPAVARYDGHADWYDGYVTGEVAAYTAAAAAALERLTGPGAGRCLDVGCGTGVLTEALDRLGWAVTGLDASADQLRVAGRRLGERVELVHGDALDLPFADESFDAVTASLVHTDVDDVARLLAEMGRVLRRGGRLVHVGVHPCFTAPGVERLPGGTRLIGPGYLDARRHESAGEGVRSRVGVRHVPLGELLNGVSAAGLVLEETLEDYGDPPLLLALAARKP